MPSYAGFDDAYWGVEMLRNPATELAYEVQPAGWCLGGRARGTPGAFGPPEVGHRCGRVIPTWSVLTTLAYWVSAQAG